MVYPAMNTLTDLRCICCRGEEIKPHLVGLLSCGRCGHVMADVDMDAFNAKDIYSYNYFKDGEYLDYVKDRACFEKNFKKRLRTLRQYKPAGRLLEIGSACGFFLNLANLFYECTGYEICTEMAQFAGKEFDLNVKAMDYLADLEHKDHYDAAVLWDCIEHLARPDLYIQKIRAELKKNGVMALTTGDIGSLVPKLQKGRWRMIHPPTHLHYFTRASISALLNRHGFQIMDIQYPGFYRSLGQMFYGCQVKSLAWVSTPVYLNLYDIMCVVAKKI